MCIVQVLEAEKVVTRGEVRVSEVPVQQIKSNQCMITTVSRLLHNRSLLSPSLPPTCSSPFSSYSILSSPLFPSLSWLLQDRHEDSDPTYTDQAKGPGIQQFPMLNRTMSLLCLSFSQVPNTFLNFQMLIIAQVTEE